MFKFNWGGTMEGCDCNGKINKDSCGDDDLKNNCSNINSLEAFNLNIF
jgi:hypothetical protein